MSEVAQRPGEEKNSKALQVEKDDRKIVALRRMRDDLSAHVSKLEAVRNEHNSFRSASYVPAGKTKFELQHKLEENKKRRKELKRELKKESKPNGEELKQILRKERVELKTEYKPARSDFKRARHKIEDINKTYERYRREYQKAEYGLASEASRLASKIEDRLYPYIVEADRQIEKKIANKKGGKTDSRGLRKISIPETWHDYLKIPVLQKRIEDYKNLWKIHSIVDSYMDTACFFIKSKILRYGTVVYDPIYGEEKEQTSKAIYFIEQLYGVDLSPFVKGNLKGKNPDNITNENLNALRLGVAHLRYVDSYTSEAENEISHWNRIQRELNGSSGKVNYEYLTYLRPHYTPYSVAEILPKHKDFISSEWPVYLNMFEKVFNGPVMSAIRKDYLPDYPAAAKRAESIDIQFPPSLVSAKKS